VPDELKGFTFEIPGEPFPQERAGEEIKYKLGKRGEAIPYIHHFDPPRSKHHKYEVKVRAQIAMNRSGIREPMEGPIEITVIAYRKMLGDWSKAKAEEAMRGERLPDSLPDGKNYLWLIEDALNGIAYKDDGQITDIMVLKRYSHEPRTMVQVRQVGRGRNAKV